MPDLGSSVFSQTDASNNGATMPGWNGSALPSTIDDAGRALQGAITREWNWRNPTITSGGTSNAQTLTYTVAPAAYYNGQTFSFIAGATNTGSTTLNVNSLGATTIKKLFNGTASNLVGGEITSGNVVTVVYNTAGSCFYLEYNDKIWSKGTDVASASTVTFGEAGYYDITGTTTITALALSTDRAGKVVTLQFDGALTLTHGASLILPSATNIVTAAGDRAAFISEGSGVFRCLWYTKAGASGIYGGAPDIILEDQKASGTAGGTFSSGADRTRTLNTEVRDVYGICSLASNQFTLPAGTYYIEWCAPAYAVDSHQSFLYNATAASEVKRGTSMYVSNTTSAMSTSTGATTVTIASSSAFDIRHRCQTSQASTGFGIAGSFGTEVYTWVRIWKIG